MSYAIRDYAVLVIPDWVPLVLSFVTLGVVLASIGERARVGKRVSVLAERCAEATDGYARSDEALAPVLEALGQSDGAESARERAVQHREMAQRLRERNRRRGWMGLFRPPSAPAERPTDPGTQDRVPNAAQAVSEPAGRER